MVHRQTTEHTGSFLVLGMMSAMPFLSAACTFRKGTSCLYGSLKGEIMHFVYTSCISKALGKARGFEGFDQTQTP